jgi:hypothetical protein
LLDGHELFPAYPTAIEVHEDCPSFTGPNFLLGKVGIVRLVQYLFNFLYAHAVMNRVVLAPHRVQVPKRSAKETIDDGVTEDKSGHYADAKAAVPGLRSLMVFQLPALVS